MDYRQVLQTGTVLDGKYRIEHVIGSGGFGITYEAYDVGLAAPVAIKEYYPSQFGIRDATFSVRPRSERDVELFERLKASFLREARTLNQFEHPAIVRVISVFEAYGTAYMVMKYETGPSLKAWLSNLVRFPSQGELDRLALPLLDALEMMHDADFLHRDIAPDNIIVRADGSPVLLDFGASRRVMGEMTGTLTGVVKKGYSPQEQYATDSRSQGPWTDIYAMGATLYRCVTGETPFEATERMLDDRIGLAADVAAGRYRQGFLQAIDAAMALRPKERPQSIADWRPMLTDGLVAPASPQSWPHLDQHAGGGASETVIAGPSSRPRNSQPRQGVPASQPRSAPSSPAARSAPSVSRGDGLAGSSAPSGSYSPPPARNNTAIGLVAGALLLVGGGATLIAFNRSSGPVTPGSPGIQRPAGPSQEELLRRADADRALREQAVADQARREAEDAVRRQNQQFEELARQAAEREAADQRRRQAEDEQRRLAAIEAARIERERVQREQQETARRQAEQERQRVAALDAARLERERLERTQREQQETARRQAEQERQRLAALDAARIERERIERTQREQQDAARRRTEEEQRRLAARPRQLPFAPPGATTAMFPATVAVSDTVIVAGGSGGAVRVWDSANGASRELQGPRHSDVVSILAVSPDGQLAVSGAWGGDIILWSLSGGGTRYQVADAPGEGAARRWIVTARFISPTRFVTLLSDGHLQTWDIATPARPVSTVRLGNGAFTSAIIASDGATVLTGSENGTVTQWNAATGQTVQTVARHGDWVMALGLSDARRLLATASADGVVRVLDIRQRTAVQRHELRGHETGVRSLSIAANGTRIATGGEDGVIIVWDAETGARLATYRDHQRSIRSLALSADGQRLVSASEDGDVRVWYLDTLVQAAAPANSGTR